MIKVKNEGKISLFIKSLAVVKLNEDNDLLLLGGFNGALETPIEDLLMLKYDKGTFKIEKLDRKIPEILTNHCYIFQKDSSFSPYIDTHNRLFLTSFDEMDNCHVIDSKSLQYDIFKFD
jgi:hypothetical protein